MKKITVECPKCNKKTFVVDVTDDPELRSLGLSLEQSDFIISITGIEFRKGKCKNKKCKYSKDEDRLDLITIAKALADKETKDAEVRLQALSSHMKESYEFYLYIGYLKFLQKNYKSAIQNLTESRKVLNRTIRDCGVYNYFWIDYILILAQLNAKHVENAHENLNQTFQSLSKEQSQTTRSSEPDKEQKLGLLNLFKFSLNVLSIMIRMNSGRIDEAKKQFLEVKKYLCNPQLIKTSNIFLLEMASICSSQGWESQCRIIVLYMLSDIIQEQVTSLMEMIIPQFDRKLQDNELKWFEETILKCLPCESNQLGCAFWYWQIKLKLNELYFDFYAKNDQIEEAFRHIESKGIDFTYFVGIDENKEPLVPPEEYPEPYRIDSTGWDTELFRYGAEDEYWLEFGWGDHWETTLQQFYVPSHMYWQFLTNKNFERKYGFQLKQRIVHLTKEYDKYLKRGYKESIRFIYPNFVGTVFEQMELYDEAIYYYENSPLSVEDKLKANDRCSFLRDGIRWEPLRKQLRILSEDEQRQLVAYAKIFQLEIRLRNIVSILIEKRHGNKNWWDCYVDKSIRQKCTERYEEWSSFQSNSTSTPKNTNLIDFLTLSELKDIMLEDTNWERTFKAYFKNKKIFSSILNLLEPIRNDIAHARLLTQEDFEDLESHIQKLDNKLNEVEKSVSTV